MISIIKATPKIASTLSHIGKITFIESHGSSAKTEDINDYVTAKYTDEIMAKELANPKNNYHLLYYNNKVAGYTNIVFDEPYPGSPVNNVTKLDRIYLMKEFYGLKLGEALLQFDIALARANNQSGLWLYTWTENKRAVSFYERSGFKIIGSYDFPISATHSNPNHRMLLEF